jgi:hypothetical protein
VQVQQVQDVLVSIFFVAHGRAVDHEVFLR